MPHVRSAAATNRRRLVPVFGLTLTIFAVEAVGGFASNSLALLADAGHMLTDVAGIGLALLAIWIGSRSPDTERTFGYQRLEILAAIVNALLLFGVGAFILFEAIRRARRPAGGCFGFDDRRGDRGPGRQRGFTLAPSGRSEHKPQCSRRISRGAQRFRRIRRRHRGGHRHHPHGLRSGGRNRLDRSSGS